MKSVVTLVLCMIVSFSFGQGINFVREDMKWADILAKAKAEKKLVFVDAYTVWCGPCKQMAKNIFPVKEVGEVFNTHFVNAKIDMEKGEGVDIAKQYTITAYPTYLFINGDGELVHRGLGSMPADKFIEVANAAKDPEKQFYTLKKKFEAGEKDPTFLKKLSFASLEAQQDGLASETSAAYLATQKDWLTDDNMAFILKFSNSIESPVYAFLVKNRAEFEKKLPKGDIESTIDNTAFENVAQFSFNRTKKEFDMVKAMEYAGKYLPRDLTEKTMSSLILYQYQMKQDMPNFLKYAITHLDKYPSNDPNVLNQYAWTFYEQSSDKAQLEKALEWSLKSLTMQDNYAFNDTAAALYFKLGDKTKAKIQAEKAIQLAKKSGDDASETEALLKKIEAMK